MESIEVECLSPKAEFVTIAASRSRSPGELVRLYDGHGHACSGVVTEPGGPASSSGSATVVVRLDFGDWRGDWSGPPPT